MLKRMITKRTKKTVTTYMKEAIDYDLLAIKQSEDLFITIKKYKKMSGKFSLKNSLGEEVTYIDEGYYVIELTPIKENYNIRYYINKNREIIDYYIDISLFNGVLDKVPFYVDLYLDILHYSIDDSVAFTDEDELQEALNNELISKKDYKLAYEVGNKLLKEIRNHENEYLNIDVLSILNNYVI